MIAINNAYSAKQTVWFLPDGAFYASEAKEPTKDPITLARTSALAMSRDTFAEIMRHDFQNQYYQKSNVKTEPDRVFGLRVVYDNSLALNDVVPLIWGRK